MHEIVLNKMPWDGDRDHEVEPLLTREWLVTNGLGGYASGTVSGACTRRYHGLLISALPNPLGRTMMLPHLSEQFRLPNGNTIRLWSEERQGSLELHCATVLKEFRLETGLPVWRYETNGFVIEKRVWLSYMQNTTYVNYRLVSGTGFVRLKLRPSLHLRSHDAPVNTPHPGTYTLLAVDDRYEVHATNTTIPPLRFKAHGENHAFTLQSRHLPEMLYRMEQSRGYESHGDIWSPGYFRADLAVGQDVTLVASTESWDAMCALAPADALAAEHERRHKLLSIAHPVAHQGTAAELVLAADQFIITPAGRTEDAARAHASGDEVRTVIAGYHWFTDWGRDTMISLEGLTLTTGRHLEAGYILRTFAHYVRDGLIPNMFPEGEKDGLYHTADATLWFFHAVSRYLAHTNDRNTLRLILPKFKAIVAAHLAGTRFGIHVDPKDGLLHQGAEGYQLTWMDAKVDGWVVTPRRGKAVEINALWYNALRLLQSWCSEEGDAAGAREYGAHAERTRTSFNARFWNPRTGCLFDVIDGEAGDDPAVRPNQVFAVSLDHPVLDREHWNAVVNVARAKLLTPVGLRSLAPGEPDYRGRYDGDLRARDAAYHQGTDWGWLAGPFVDAWLRLYPDDKAGARKILEGFVPHLGEACIGSISEIFDAEAPYTPRGCIAQAWSVAEVLRCWVKTAR